MITGPVVGRLPPPTTDGRPRTRRIGPINTYLKSRYHIDRSSRLDNLSAESRQCLRARQPPDAADRRGCTPTRQRRVGRVDHQSGHSRGRCLARRSQTVLSDAERTRRGRGPSRPRRPRGRAEFCCTTVGFTPRCTGFDGARVRAIRSAAPGDVRSHLSTRHARGLGRESAATIAPPLRSTHLDTRCRRAGESTVHSDETVDLRARNSRAALHPSIRADHRQLGSTGPDPLCSARRDRRRYRTRDLTDAGN